MKNFILPLYGLFCMAGLLFITNLTHAQDDEFLISIPFAGQLDTEEEGPFTFTVEITINDQELSPVIFEDVNLDDNGFFNFTYENPELDALDDDIELDWAFYERTRAGISVSNTGGEIINTSFSSLFPDLAVRSRITNEISRRGIDQKFFIINDDRAISLSPQNTQSPGAFIYNPSPDTDLGIVEFKDPFFIEIDPDGRRTMNLDLSSSGSGFGNALKIQNIPVNENILPNTTFYYDTSANQIQSYKLDENFMIDNDQDIIKYNIEQPMQDIFGLSVGRRFADTSTIFRINPIEPIIIREEIPGVNERIVIGATLGENEFSGLTLGVNGAAGPNAALTITNGTPEGRGITAFTSQGSNFFTDGTEGSNTTLFALNFNTESEEDNSNTAIMGIVSEPGPLDWAAFFDGPVCVTGGNLFVDGEILTPSDSKRKSDISDFDNALARVMELQPKTYYLTASKANARQTQRPRFGFIAQDMEKTFPSLVSEVVQPTIGLDDGSTPILESAETLKTVNYMELIPVLTKAMQEQQSTIEELKATVSALQEKLLQLEGK